MCRRPPPLSSGAHRPEKKVVFCSYYGKGYSDSPKAIAEALLASGEDLKLVWLLRDPKDAAHLPEGISPASYRGIRRVWELSTAAAWVDNCRKGERCKRKGSTICRPGTDLP